MILKYNDNHVSWYNRWKDQKKWIKYAKSTNEKKKKKSKSKIKTDTQIAKESGGGKKFCARIEIAFFSLCLRQYQTQD